jgi:hypothetical protein
MKYRVIVYELLDHVLCTVTSFDMYGEEGTSRTRLITIPSSDVHVGRAEEVFAELSRLMQN